jgi:phosphopantetheinyl transferase (holo-ACP synthase)
MIGRTPARGALFLALSTLFSAPLFAQYVCDFGNGPLDSAAPAGITTNEIIERFATKESTFKAARQHYGYTVDVTVQTMNGNAIDGTFHQESEVTVNDRGEPVEKTTNAPQNTLRSLSLSKDDLDDIRERLPFVLTADHLSQFAISYAGRQHVDELNTYVFDVAPKNDKKDQVPPPAFKGRVWVDDRDFVIVKTCGKARPDENAASLSRNAPANLTPTFVTYREQIDGKYWFTTYARADEILHFPNGGVHIRELVKYTSYKAVPPR